GNLEATLSVLGVRTVLEVFHRLPVIAIARQTALELSDCHQRLLSIGVRPTEQLRDRLDSLRRLALHPLLLREWWSGQAAAAGARAAGGSARGRRSRGRGARGG